MKMRPHRFNGGVNPGFPLGFFGAPEGRSVAGDWEFEPGVGRSHEHPMEKARLQHGPLHAPCVCSFQIRIFEYAPCGRPGNRLTLSNRSDSALSER